VFSSCLHGAFLISIATAAVALIVSLFIKNARFGAPPSHGAQTTESKEEQKEVAVDEEKGIATIEDA
jgi:hypothetical protein